MENYCHLGRDNPRAMHIEAFLMSLDVSPLAGDQRPTTWVELYILYVARGYEVLEVSDQIAFAQPTADMLLRKFKNLCRAVVARTLPSKGVDANLFACY